jgi:hypothetical protein
MSANSWEVQCIIIQYRNMKEEATMLYTHIKAAVEVAFMLHNTFNNSNITCPHMANLYQLEATPYLLADIATLWTRAVVAQRVLRVTAVVLKSGLLVARHMPEHCMLGEAATTHISPLASAKEERVVLIPCFHRHLLQRIHRVILLGVVATDLLLVHRRLGLHVGLLEQVCLLSLPSNMVRRRWLVRPRPRLPSNRLGNVITMSNIGTTKTKVDVNIRDRLECPMPQ